MWCGSLLVLLPLGQEIDVQRVTVHCEAMEICSDAAKGEGRLRDLPPFAWLRSGRDTEDRGVSAEAA